MSAHENFLAEFKKNHPDREVIFLMVAGSHFFDLNGPKSDFDYRGIYMPSTKEFYEGEGKRRMSEYKTKEGNVKNVKNDAGDVDFTMFSITKFLDLLASGDFNMMEILHAPEDKILIDSELMKELRDIRKSLMINDISAFLGFIKNEYKRYGVNIQHFTVQENFMKFLEQFHPHTVMKDVWKDIQEYAKNDEYISFTESQTGKKVYVPSIKVAQRLYQNTVRTGYIVDALRHRLSMYGHRQRNMAAAGVEYKGLYHAQRLIYEANDLFDLGEMEIPFNEKRHTYLKAIKEGTVPQEELFSNLDNDIEDLYMREKQIVTNRTQIRHIVDKLIFRIEGEQRIKYILNNPLALNKPKQKPQKGGKAFDYDPFMG